RADGDHAADDAEGDGRARNRGDDSVGRLEAIPPVEALLATAFLARQQRRIHLGYSGGRWRVRGLEVLARELRDLAFDQQQLLEGRVSQLRDSAQGRADPAVDHVEPFADVVAIRRR